MQGTAATGALGLGAGITGSAMEPLTHATAPSERLAGGMKPSVKNIQKLYDQLQPGDIISYGDPAHDKSIMKRLSSWVTGNPNNAHASMVMRDSSGRLTMTSPTDFARRPKPRNPFMHRMFNAIKKKGKGALNWATVRKALYKAQRDATLPGSLSAADVAEQLHKDPGVMSTLRTLTRGDDTPVSIYRAKGGLKPGQLAQLEKNLATVGAHSFSPVDSMLSGAKRLIAPKSVASLMDFNPNAANCAGGICGVYKGVSNLGSPGSSLPSDFARSNKLETVGQLLPKGQQARAATKGITKFLRGAGKARLAAGLPLLLAGGMGLRSLYNGRSGHNVDVAGMLQGLKS